eukprot:TRINITY_DN11601_c0_g1_i1.p1 TRINITY_DN11601_c0_g1~~TRINITY_DN11601_c0_g1_i1.p1  ORF type:complete len:378 (-),score=60.86 TRINITY_DN11601_c0_g1_i1:491-1624(-)
MLQLLRRSNKQRTYQPTQYHYRCINTGYSNAVNKLNKIINTPVNEDQKQFKLQDMKQYLKHININIPELSRKVIHIAGTNGKGSTSFLTDAIIRKYGYTTGMFTSPHLITFRERIRINGKPISEDLFSSYFWDCYDKLQAYNSDVFPRFFQFMTLLALKVFQEENVNCIIMEVGIGGTYDCTNVFETSISGVTMIDYDHQKILGSTLAEIATNKGGIFKKNVPAFTFQQSQEVIDALTKCATRAKTSLILVPEWKLYREVSRLPAPEVEKFQDINKSVAVCLSAFWLLYVMKEDLPSFEYLLKFVNADGKNYVLPTMLPDNFIESINSIKIPGREQVLQNFNNANFTCFLDGAHTPKSLNMCYNWYKKNTTGVIFLR